MKPSRIYASSAALLLLTAAFLAALTVFVCQGAACAEEYRRNLPVFLRLMAVDALFLLAGSLWSLYSRAFFQSLLSAVSILFAVGGAYQLLFPDYERQAFLHTLGLGAAVAVYLICRRIDPEGLHEGWFYLLAVGVAGLLAANVLLGSGKEEVGADLWILIGGYSLQPGELIKPILAAMGALSFRRPRRIALYSLCAMGSCLTMVLLKDLGAAVVIFVSFVLMTYLLLDSRSLSLSVIGGAFAGFVMVVRSSAYAAERIGNWGNAMIVERAQQRQIMTAAIFGGFRGLGFEKAHFMTSITAAETDCVPAGILAVYGLPLLMVVIGCYCILILQAGSIRSLYPACYLIAAQTAVVILINVLLNLCGSLDVLPFTGITAPFLSAGGSSALSFGALLGMTAAALHPRLKVREEVF